MNILRQGVPEGFDLAKIKADLLAIPGVADVHDLHLWALTSGRNVLTAHLVLENGAGDEHYVLQASSDLLRERYSISEVTLQVEPDGFHADAEPDVHQH